MARAYRRATALVDLSFPGAAALIESVSAK
jgi:hypothetical protein